jgi:hypothetical protein
MDSENIVELVLRGGTKQHACTDTVNFERAIKVHLPMLRVISWYRLLDFGPFGDKSLLELAT